MKQGSARLSRDILSDAQSQFERWRWSRSRGTRIPATLWDAAVEAAREHGVSKVAGALRLDYYRLKERLEAAPKLPGLEAANGGGFLEIPLYASSAAECRGCVPPTSADLGQTPRRGSDRPGRRWSGSPPSAA